MINWSFAGCKNCLERKRHRNALEGFTRGVAFINGFNLGRHWDIENSDNKLFIPAPLIKEGKNQIVVFDVLHKDCPKKLTFGEFKK